MFLASQHYSRVLKEAHCSRPLQRVVHLDQLYPSAHKKYVPRCTVLYVCGDASGCCLQENQQCVAKSHELVTLYFLTVELTEKGNQKKGVEQLVFKNDTECHCQTIASG